MRIVCVGGKTRTPDLLILVGAKNRLEGFYEDWRSPI